MKVLKYFGITLLGIILLIIIAGLIAPTSYQVERSVVIKASKAVVFDNIVHWEKWHAWSPWAEIDTVMKIEITGEDGTVGSMYRWVGDPELTGRGEMTNTGVKHLEELTYDLHFIEPFESHSQGYIRLSGEDGNITAAWGFFGEYSFPMNIMLLFVDMDEMMDKDFRHGLELLKNICEKEEIEISKYEIKKIDFPATKYAAVKGTVSATEIQNFFSESYATLGAAIGKNRARITGMPAGIYYSVDTKNWIFEMAAAMPVNKAVETDVVKTVEFAADAAYVIDYFGSYEDMTPAYRAFEIYFLKNNLKAKMPSIEEYVTDPGKEPDTAKWLTKIYFFVE